MSLIEGEEGSLRRKPGWLRPHLLLQPLPAGWGLSKLTPHQLGRVLSSLSFLDSQPDVCEYQSATLHWNECHLLGILSKKNQYLPLFTNSKSGRAGSHGKPKSSDH